MKTNKKSYNITIVRPSGNDTALIDGIVGKKKKKLLNDIVLKQFSHVEQVGFYSYDKQKNLATLEMAGGEFCGNALRSLAYLLLDGRKGRIYAKVSGTDQVLKAGVTNDGKAYAQMPIFKDFDSVQKLNKKLCEVKLSGITHLITTSPAGDNPQTLKKLGFSLLKKQRLDVSSPAAGVMFWRKQSGKIKLEPVVWVRDIKTLFYETACASGTTALGLFLAKETTSSKDRFSILQPSGQYISITIEKDEKGFKKASILGDVQILQKEVIIDA